MTVHVFIVKHSGEKEMEMGKKFTISELERIRLESLFSEVNDDLADLISGPMTDVVIALKYLCKEFPTGAHIASECRQLRGSAYSILQDMKQLQQDLSRLDLESLVNDEA